VSPIAATAARLLRPSHRAHWVLIGLVIAAVTVRAIAVVSWWPTTTSFADSGAYAVYAEGNGLDNPQHPAGYSWLLAILGVITREVAAPVILQHLAGIAAGLVFYAAVVRLTGSPWAALAPAAVVLLSGDLAYLEHSISSEGPFTLVLATTLYAAVRSLDQPRPLLGWPLAAGALLALGTIIRSAGFFLAPVVVLALLLARPRPWRANLAVPGAVAGVFAGLLLCYAIASEVTHGRFEVGPSQGWRLYSRVAPFADCSRFTPPAGTEVLCESTPPEKRNGSDWYLYDEGSPARRHIGKFGERDSDVGAFARQVVLHQPIDFVEELWPDIRGYYVPGAYPFRNGAGANLDGQIEWEASLPPDSGDEARLRARNQRFMETFFDDFTEDLDRAGLEFLDGYQRIFGIRFGATLLTVTTLLTLFGMLIGARRERIGVLLFGVGGLVLLIAPTLTVFYVGRYTIPLAGPMVAAGSIACLSLWRLESERRREEREASARAL
jgi:hypothetical protein